MNDMPFEGIRALFGNSAHQRSDKIFEGRGEKWTDLATKTRLVFEFKCSGFAIGHCVVPPTSLANMGLLTVFFLLTSIFQGCCGTTLQISIDTLLRCSLSMTLYSPPAFVSYERNNLLPDDGPTYNVGRRCPLHELQRS